MNRNSLLCAGLAALAYGLLNVGLALEKKGAAALPAVEKTGLRANLKNFLTSPVWVAGFALTNVQLVPFWASLTLGPLSLVSPMLGAGLAVLVPFSVFFLEESVNRPMLAGMALAIAGIALFGAASGGVRPPPGWDESLAILGRGGSLAFLAVLVAGAVAPVPLSAALGHRYADVLFGVASGFATSLGMLFAKLMMAAPGEGQAAFGLAAALGRWQSWLLLLLVFACNGSSMVLQQIGFQKGKAIVLAPVFGVCCVIVPALAGVVLFQEWSGDPGRAIAMKLGGIAAVLAGVAMLSAFNQPAAAPAGRD